MADSPRTAAAMPSLEAPGVTIVEPGTECDAAAASVSHATASASPDAVKPVVEYAADNDTPTAIVEGVMYHDGLNKNAWGMTEAGAKAIADSLVGDDLTASHPFIRLGQYDRAVASGPGRPIGDVLETSVVDAEQAMLDGGSYTADYIAGVTDPEYVTRYASGNLTGDGYGVSVGIYGEHDTAVCNVCGEQFEADDHDHSRGERIVVESGDSDEEMIAGPLFKDGESDHLAAVYLPAYEDATASVDSVDAAQTQTPVAAKQVADQSHPDQSGSRPPLVATMLDATDGFAATDAATAAATDSSAAESGDTDRHADVDFPVRVTADAADTTPADAAADADGEPSGASFFDTYLN